MTPRPSRAATRAAPLTVLAATLLLALPAFAEGTMRVEDAHARIAGALAQSGAAFMTIANETGRDDRLVAAATSDAARAELHMHEEADGVMRMREAEGGWPIPAGGTLTLAPGGRHVMLLGLTGAPERLDLTLTFERAGEVTLTLPVTEAPR